MRKFKISSSKKVLLTIAFMAIALVGKVFAQKTYTSILSSDVHYTSSSTLAKDIKAGKLKLSSNVTELFWINRTLNRWNIALNDGQVFKPGDVEIFQLSSSFTNLQDARDYIADILSNHCKDFNATFKKGDYKIGRAEEGVTNVISVDLERDARAGEKITMLVPSSFTGKVSKSDGDYPLIDGFSLYCLNDTEKIKVKKPDPIQPIVAVKEEKKSGGILSPGHEVTYNPISDGYTTTIGNNTYNTYNTVNNPAPVVVKDNRNGQMWLMVGMTVVGQVLSTGLQMWAINQQYKVSQRQVSNYQVIQYYPLQTLNAQTAGTPIQGNTGAVDYTPIQGNTGGTVSYTPIQGNGGGTVGYNPIQGYGQ